MKIGFIGAGFVGRTVGRLAVKAGHEVMLSNARGARTLFSVRVSVGCEVGAPEEAAAFGDVVVVGVPLSAYRSVPVAPLAGKVVIDANNYYWERDGRIGELDRGETTSSDLLARHLPAARIVKAFNAVRMDDLERDSRPTASPDRLALPLAGDDAVGKAIAGALIEAFGYDPVDAGTLSEGWRFERDQPAYCARLDRGALKRALAAAIRRPSIAA